MLAEAGVQGPRFALCADAVQAAVAAREIGYPLVVKPVDLCAGMLVREVRDERELEAACRALEEFPVNARGQDRMPVILLEEFLTGPEVSVETVSFGGVIGVAGVTDKSIGGAPAFIETGHMFPADIAPEAERKAVDTAVAAIKALGLDRVVCHTEIKLTPEGPKVVEVNARPAGNRITELVRHVTGIDLAAACVDVALGRMPDLTPRATGVHSAAIAFLLPDTTGTLTGIKGADEVRAQPGVLELTLAEPGRAVRAATSNNEYLGHIMTADIQGTGARESAEQLLAHLHPTYDECPAELPSAVPA